MAEKVRGIPFDANEIILPDGSPGYDNIIYSADFAEWMATYFKNGVLVPGGALISDELKVTKTDDTHIRISKGNIVVNGRTAFLTSPIIMEISQSVPDKLRIDRIVFELNLDENVNCFQIKVISGETSVSPLPPSIVRTEEIYQMSLATITVGVSGINEVEDDRPTESLCGISQVLIGVKPPLPVTGDEAVNISYDNSSSGLVGDTVQSAIDEVVTKFDEIVAMFDKYGNLKGAVLSNVSVPLSSWVSVSGYSEAKFKADIVNSIITSDMIADVIFAPDDADKGIFSGACLVDTRKITLLSKQKPASTTIIPKILLTKVV